MYIKFIMAVRSQSRVLRLIKVGNFRGAGLEWFAGDPNHAVGIFVVCAITRTPSSLDNFKSRLAYLQRTRECKGGLDHDGSISTYHVEG